MQLIANLISFGQTPPPVSLPAEPVWQWAGLPFTNSMTLGLAGYGLVVWLFLAVARGVKRGSRGRVVLAIQWLFEILLGNIEQVVGSRKLARRLAPLAITLFFFIMINYWLSVLPVVGPVTWGGVPLFRSLAADLNVTFALAIISMVAAQLYAIKTHGFFANGGRYFKNPFKDLIGAFEGVLEFIAEFSRLTALSLRLFGNVFAGEVLLGMVGFMSGWLAPLSLPFFMVFELFIGAVQAYVFFMLTVVFVSLGTVSHSRQPHTGKRREFKKTAAAG